MENFKDKTTGIGDTQMLENMSEENKILDKLNKTLKDVGLLRQLVGEGLSDTDIIYKKLDEIAPLMTAQQRKEFDKYNPFQSSPLDKN